MRNDRTYLTHIREAIESIEEYLKGVSYEQFASSKMMIDDAMHSIQFVRASRATPARAC